MARISILFYFVASTLAIDERSFLRSRQVDICDTLKGCYLVNIKSKEEQLLSENSNNLYELQANNEVGYSIRCDVTKENGDSNYISFFYDNKNFTEWGYPRFMNGNAHEGEWIIPSLYLSTCGAKKLSIEGHIWSKLCFNKVFNIEMMNSNKEACNPLAETKVPSKVPSKAPTKAPVRTPTNAPKKVPVKTPVRTPTKAPVKLPTNAPSGSPFKAQTQTASPMNTPVTPNPPVKNVEPTNSPTAKPSTSPIKPPMSTPIKAPSRSPIKTSPTKSPVRVKCQAWYVLQGGVCKRGVIRYILSLIKFW